MSSSSSKSSIKSSKSSKSSKSQSNSIKKSKNQALIDKQANLNQAIQNSITQENQTQPSGFSTSIENLNHPKNLNDHSNHHHHHHSIENLNSHQTHSIIPKIVKSHSEEFDPLVQNNLHLTSKINHLSLSPQIDSIIHPSDQSLPASREGTCHTTATTTEQTLVESNESLNSANDPNQTLLNIPSKSQKIIQSNPSHSNSNSINLNQSINQSKSIDFSSSNHLQSNQMTNNNNLIQSELSNNNNHNHTDSNKNGNNNNQASANNNSKPITSSPDDQSINPQSNPINPSTSKNLSKSTLINQQTNKPKNRNRKKIIRFLLPCFHSSSHDDDPSTPQPIKSNSNSKSKSKPLTSHEMSQSKNPSQHPLTTSSISSASITNPQPTKSPISIVKHLKQPIKQSSNYSTISLPPRSSRRNNSDHLLPKLVSDTVTPAGAAAATSAANIHGSAGVQLPIDETEGVLSAAVVPPGKDALAIKKSASVSKLNSRNYSRSDNIGGSSEDPNSDRESLRIDETDHDDELDGMEDDEEDRIVAMGGIGIPVGEDGVARPLLADLDTIHQGRKCLVLDLDETLVHSSFKMIPQSDFIVPVEIENTIHNVYVIKRPGVDQFMKKMGEIYEIVVFTASLSKYADPVLDKLDIHRVVKHRLFRESCYNHKGNYVKDLSQLGRPIGETIIIDNSPASYIFHPSNAVPVSSWFNDPHDTELTDLAAFLADIAHVPDVRGILDPRL
ncbi:hypothetical protein O181_001982 [Austropuccinia psidii MF-1]|uniref:FCP1 homology domain-containing protein n=1 Tax=Austropuccinia psidii MF-1 TaxID=1389203 RepID=A0A9Q3GDK2_9BASI|nr:hypothetical protein [Austropuccinia psidii MF-1]